MASIPSVVKPSAPALATATHDVLFHALSDHRCDACGEPLPASAGDDDEGYGLRGQGVYMWTRGDDVRFESAPLCASCASAIGMTALARWEIEEEEG
ncbi:MAG: hypothetical protein FWD17_11270 [Polyangiaceae bacterium]|nr:hypothetical protein [Polyangiaceae bacterium]